MKKAAHDCFILGIRRVKNAQNATFMRAHTEFDSERLGWESKLIITYNFYQEFKGMSSQL